VTSERRTDLSISLALFVVSALVRIPFRSAQLFHGDSYGLAAGVMYTLTAHPPGFIGYCALVRLAYYLAGDVNLAFVIVNVISTGAATALAYLLGRHLFDRRVGLIAAVLYATSLDASYFAETALSYAAEGAFATAAALTAWLSVKKRSFGWLLAHTAVLAIGGSVRQTTLAFLLPLWLWVVWRAVPRWWQRACAFVVLVAVVATWSIPNAQRLAKYWDQKDVSYFESVYKLQVTMDQYYDSARFGAVTYDRDSYPRFHWPLVELGVAIWNRFEPPAADAPREVRLASASNALRLMLYQTAKLLLYAGIAMGLATAFVLLAIRKRVRMTFDQERWIFLALWILPAAAFFALNHLGSWGYLLIFLAGLATIAAQAIVVLFPARARIIAAVLALTNVLAFLFMRPLPETSERNRLLNIAILQYSAPAIRMHFARARSSGFKADPRQLPIDCVTDECLERLIPRDFHLPQDLKPVRPLGTTPHPPSAPSPLTRGEG
jgi:4-amino-4-deoxy-L-arabinose transferase-like glycosyltransferase